MKVHSVAVAHAEPLLLKTGFACAAFNSKKHDHKGISGPLKPTPGSFRLSSAYARRTHLKQPKQDTLPNLNRHRSIGH